MNKILLAFLLMFTFPLVAQQQLNGKIFDFNTKKPLSGATIINSEGDGTVSDKNGLFEIECSHKIIVSFIGMETMEQKVENCESFPQIYLKPRNTALKEVEIDVFLDSHKSMLEVPAAVVELDQKELNRSTGLFLNDAINSNIPGVYMSRRGVSSGQQFNIRGAGNGVGFKGANNNFDTQGTKIYLNGIPLTDAEGITILDDLDFASIGNVEVIKGPSGTIYGQAIAGVVKLQTVKPETNQISIGEEFLIGSYGLMRSTTGLHLGKENSSLLVNYGHQESDGFMAHTASEEDFVNFLGEFSPNSKQNISAYFGYSNSYDARGGELTIEQYENLDYSGNVRYIKNNAHSEISIFRAGLSHEYLFNENLANTTTLFGSGATMNSSSAAGWSENNPLNYGFRSTFQLNYDLSSDFILSGITGLEIQQQKSNPLGYNMVADSSNENGYNIIGSMKSNKVSRTANYSYFTEWVLAMRQGFSFTAGIGLNNVNIELDNRLYDAESEDPNHYEISYNNLFSPHFAVNKIFNENISVYVSFSTAYNTPGSSNIVINATGNLNTGLVPEEARQFEIGSKGNLLNEKFQYRMAVFRTNFSNKMTSVAVPLDSETTAYTYVTNGGGQINKGFEMLAKYIIYNSKNSFFSFIRPWVNFSYSDFTYDDFSYELIPRGKSSVVTENYDGKAVAGVSPINANAGIDFSTNYGFYGNVNYSYKDALPITSNGEFMTESFNLLNAKIGFKRMLGEHFDLELYAGADNFTGTQYYYMVFINQLNDAYLPAPINTNFYSGIHLKYIF